MDWKWGLVAVAFFEPGCARHRAQQCRGAETLKCADRERPCGAVGGQGFSLLVSFCLFEKSLDILLALDITWFYLPAKWIERACGFNGASFYKCLFILC